MRGLSQVSTKNGVFSILALDHRNNLRNALNPANPGMVGDKDLIDFKAEVVETITPAASSVILDPEFSAAQCIVSASLPGDRGLICAVESTGYTGEPNARKSEILPGWSVEKAKRMGAQAVKLLVYYHPKSDTCKEIEELIVSVAEDCQRSDLVLFIEPLSYSLVKGEKLSPRERRSIVVETAARLSGLGADVLKAEFPLDILAMPDTTQWEKACDELTKASQLPWILLSASVDFETYQKQVEIACQSGCSGVAAGRAVWKEAVELHKEQRVRFLQDQGRLRMKQLTDLCDKKAVSWRNYFTAKEYSTTWYREYS